MYKIPGRQRRKEAQSHLIYKANVTSVTNPSCCRQTARRYAPQQKCLNVQCDKRATAEWNRQHLRRLTINKWLSSEFKTSYQREIFAFSALTLLFERQEEHPACKNWVMRCWRGYLSGERCRLFAYGPADATAIPKTLSSLASFQSRLVLPFWYRLTQVVLEKRQLNGCCSSSYQREIP